MLPGHYLGKVVDLVARIFLVTCFAEKRRMIGHFSRKCSTEEGSRDCAPILLTFFTKLFLTLYFDTKLFFKIVFW